MLYENIVRPLLFKMSDDPEVAHEWILDKLSYLGANNIELLEGFEKYFYKVENPLLDKTVMGLKFCNPVGLAAGFDKNAVALTALSSFGFGFLEVGTVCNLPQPGNKRPRIFRLPEQEALINSMGFPSLGAEMVRNNLRLSKDGIDVPIGINIGKTKDVDLNSLRDIINDYLGAFTELYSQGDYIDICVSSPNTPGLRDIQTNGYLEPLLAALKSHSQKLFEEYGGPEKPLLLKVDPDIKEDKLEDIVRAVLNTGFNGIVASNTSVYLRNANSKYLIGGYSGPDLFCLNQERVKHIREMSKDLVIIGVGGISDGVDAYKILRAGADLVQIFTSFVYGGPSTPKKIIKGLLKMLNGYHIRTLKET